MATMRRANSAITEILWRLEKSPICTQETGAGRSFRVPRTQCDAPHQCGRRMVKCCPPLTISRSLLGRPLHGQMTCRVFVVPLESVRRLQSKVCSSLVGPSADQPKPPDIIVCRIWTFLDTRGWCDVQPQLAASTMSMGSVWLATVVWLVNFYVPW